MQPRHGRHGHRGHRAHPGAGDRSDRRRGHRERVDRRPDRRPSPDPDREPVRDGHAVGRVDRILGVRARSGQRPVHRPGCRMDAEPPAAQRRRAEHGHLRPDDDTSRTAPRRPSRGAAAARRSATAAADRAPLVGRRSRPDADGQLPGACTITQTGPNDVPAHADRDRLRAGPASHARLVRPAAADRRDRRGERLDLAAPVRDLAPDRSR